MKKIIFLLLLLGLIIYLISPGLLTKAVRKPNSNTTIILKKSKPLTKPNPSEPGTEVNLGSSDSLTLSKPGIKTDPRDWNSVSNTTTHPPIPVRPKSFNYSSSGIGNSVDNYSGSGSSSNARAWLLQINKDYTEDFITALSMLDSDGYAKSVKTSSAKAKWDLQLLGYRVRTIAATWADPDMTDNKTNTKTISVPLTDKVVSQLLSTTSGTELLRNFSPSLNPVFLAKFYQQDSKIKTFECGHSKDNLTPYNYFLNNRPAARDLSMLRPEDFKDFLLFDIFNDSCSHGQKVYDVVKEILMANQLSFAINKVKKIPVNYYSNMNNKNFGDSLMLQYKKKFSTESAVEVSAEKFENNKGRDDITPTTYLIYAYKLNNTPDADIISSSYGSKSDQIFHSLVFASNTDTTNYIAAAGNEDSVCVEDYYQRIPSESDEAPGLTEPQYTYIRDREIHATILVGNMVSNENCMGRFSKSGSGVQALGRGIGWGDSSSCIKPKDVGTSFSTPEIATKLFIAKAYWRNRGEKINGKEARKRLILSSDLSPLFVGRYGSGGMINLDKLLQTGVGYLVKKNGEIVPFEEIKASSSIWSSTDNAGLFRVSMTESSSFIRGLYYEGSKLFIFKNNEEEKWSEVKNVESMMLSLKIGGENRTIELDEFHHDYKQLVLLKK